MKLLQFRKGNKIRLGVLTEAEVMDVEKAGLMLGSKLPATMEELINSGESGLKALKSLLDKIQKEDYLSTIKIPLENIRYAPCVSSPEKIICAGLNYMNHAAEFKSEIPEHPILFSKYANALAGHQELIRLPANASKFDYEAELVIVIGKTASNVKEEEALSYVFGYTAGNDLSARDLQFRSSQWLLGKTCDGFAPVGPWIVTADELTNPQSLDIQCKVNGVLRQSASTKDMIFDCARLVSYASQYMTLKPGDIIFTGTPGGVILGDPPSEQKWLKAGDIIEVSIESIGTLTNILA